MNAVELKLPERVVFENTPELVEELAGALPARGAAELDLAGCREFDSSLVALLLELSRRAAAGGGRLRLANPSANLRKLTALYGVDGLLFVDRD